MEEYFENQDLEKLFSEIESTYNWRCGHYPDEGNNWEGHYFTAPNGWYFETQMNYGPFGVPISELVFVYDENHNILPKELSVPFKGKIIMLKFMEEKYKYGYFYGKNNDICTAMVEYLYALYKYNESKE